MVAPKKAALFEAESELQAQMNTLNAKRAQLQGVLDKLQVRGISTASSYAVLFYCQQLCTTLKIIPVL